MITSDAELADGLRERQRDAGEDPGKDVREDDAPERRAARDAPSECAASSISWSSSMQHRLHRPDDERERDEEQREHDRRRA